jgi:ribosomal protein S4
MTLKTKYSRKFRRTFLRISLNKYNLKNIRRCSKGYRNWLKNIKNNLQAYYKLRFTLKQKLKRYYGKVKEKSFHKIFNLSLYYKRNHFKKFFVLLERRLDAVLCRASLSHSIYHSRQLIHHGYISVNGKIIKNSNYLINPEDIIHIRKDYIYNLSNILYNFLKKKIIKQKFNFKFQESYNNSLYFFNKLILKRRKKTFKKDLYNINLIKKINNNFFNYKFFMKKYNDIHDTIFKISQNKKKKKLFKSNKKKSFLKVKKYKINNNLNKISTKSIVPVKPVSQNLNLSLKRRLHTIKPLNKSYLKKNRFFNIKEKFKILMKLYGSQHILHNISRKPANNLLIYFITKLAKINNLKKDTKVIKTLKRYFLKKNINLLNNKFFMYYKLKFLNINKKFFINRKFNYNLFKIIKLKLNYQDLLNKNLNYIQIQKNLKEKNLKEKNLKLKKKNNRFYKYLKRKNFYNKRLKKNYLKSYEWAEYVKLNFNNIKQIKIKLFKKYKFKKLISNLLIPNYLMVNYKTFSVIMTHLPGLKEIPYSTNSLVTYPAVFKNIYKHKK